MDGASGVIINKTMDREDLNTPAARRIIDDLNALVAELQAKGLAISPWIGTLRPLSPQWREYESLNRGIDYAPLPGAANDGAFPWFLYWEIAWLCLNNDFLPGDKLLDIGGCSSLFSYYMAAKGLHVTTIDIQQSLIHNANAVASRTGWQLRNLLIDARKLQFLSEFDHVTAICVYGATWTPALDLGSAVGAALTANGSCSITFDYANPSRKAPLKTPTDVQAKLVERSGLRIRGNEAFCDNGKRYLTHPVLRKDSDAGMRRWFIRGEHFTAGDFEVDRIENRYTFGALFLRK